MNFFKKIKERFEWKKKIRKLSLSTSGVWYLVLTIGLGVVSLASGNNVIYLIESLLLSGLILSGILSEKAISSIRVDFLRVQARAEEKTQDWIVIKNQSSVPFFCIEIGEYKNGKIIPLLFLTKIDSKETLRLKTEQVFKDRGIYRWDGFSITTSAPFGFAKKTKIVKMVGERIIWPMALKKLDETQPKRDAHFGRRSAESDVVDGEIRPYDLNDDARMIIAKHSVKGAGPMVRNRRPTFQDPEILLDTRMVPGEHFESLVKNAASSFYGSDRGELILIRKEGRKKFIGSKLVLNTLALIRAEGA